MSGIEWSMAPDPSMHCLETRKYLGRLFEVALVFVLLALYFSLWALVKPPFQAPDEFNHAIKSYSIATSPFFTPIPEVQLKAKYLNPLLDAEILHQIPFHGERKISQKDVFLLRSYEWLDSGTSTERFTSMFNYPYVYYQAVFGAGEVLTTVFNASPYESIYLYRIGSSIIAALAWTLVYISLPPLLPHKKYILVFLVFNPMAAFMTSSINPDAFLYPSACMVMTWFWRAGFERQASGHFAMASLVCAGLTKASSLLFFPAIAISSAVAFFVQNTFQLRRAVMVLVGSLVLLWFSFYAWVPRPDNVAYAGVPVHLDLFEYLTGNRYWGLFQSYWGILGWLDYGLATPYYLIFVLLIAINLVLVLVQGREWLRFGFTWYVFLVSLLFIAASFAVEYHLLPRYGWVLQGRYFLPVSLGLAMLMVHRFTWARNAFLAYLVLFNVLLFAASVDRYYSGDWKLAWHALPFSKMPAGTY